MSDWIKNTILTKYADTPDGLTPGGLHTDATTPSVIKGEEGCEVTPAASGLKEGPAGGASTDYDDDSIETQAKQNAYRMSKAASPASNRNPRPWLKYIYREQTGGVVDDPGIIRGQKNLGLVNNIQQLQKAAACHDEAADTVREDQCSDVKAPDVVATESPTDTVNLGSDDSYSSFEQTTAEIQKRAAMNKAAISILMFRRTMSQPLGIGMPDEHHSSPCAQPVEDKMPGGAADGMPDSDFPADDLQEGTQEELEEHTDDPQIAKEIAKDHLAENEMHYENQRSEDKLNTSSEYHHKEEGDHYSENHYTENPASSDGFEDAFAAQKNAAMDVLAENLDKQAFLGFRTGREGRRRYANQLERMARIRGAFHPQGYLHNNPGTAGQGQKAIDDSRRHNAAAMQHARQNPSSILAPIRMAKYRQSMGYPASYGAKSQTPSHADQAMKMRQNVIDALKKGGYSRPQRIQMMKNLEGRVGGQGYGKDHIAAYQKGLDWLKAKNKRPQKPRTYTA